MDNKADFKWKQERNKIYLRYKDFNIHFEVPKDFKLEKIHPTLLRLVEYLTFGPFKKDLFNKNTILKWPKREFIPNGKLALAWSTGCDSTAAMLLLPKETILFYHQRDEYLGGQLNQENALSFIKELKKERKNIYVMKSNHEKVRKYFNLRAGFSTDFSSVTGLVLLADYFGLGSIATGTILGSTFIEKGHKYRNFNQFWDRWNMIFNQAGLEIIFPIGGVSEVLTNKIVNESKYNKLCHSCLRGRNGKDCENCYKCFRKHLLNGEKTNITDEVVKNIEGDHIHQADALIYGYQRSKYFIPFLEKFKYLDLSFLERYYDYALEKLVSERFRMDIIKNLNKFGIKPMTDEDIIKLKNIDIK